MSFINWSNSHNMSSEWEVRIKKHVAWERNVKKNFTPWKMNVNVTKVMLTLKLSIKVMTLTSLSSKPIMHYEGGKKVLTERGEDNSVKCSPKCKMNKKNRELIMAKWIARNKTINLWFLMRLQLQLWRRTLPKVNGDEVKAMKLNWRIENTNQMTVTYKLKATFKKKLKAEWGLPKWKILRRQTL